MGCGEGSNSNCDGVDGGREPSKISMLYEEKVVMVVVMKDRVMVGIAVHWMSC